MRGGSRDCAAEPRRSRAQRLDRDGDPADTPGLRAFDNLVASVDRALQAGLAPPHDNPVRLATLIWTADHGIVLARIARPTFPWPPLDPLVDEMVNRIMAFQTVK